MLAWRLARPCGLTKTNHFISETTQNTDAHKDFQRLPFIGHIASSRAVTQVWDNAVSVIRIVICDAQRKMRSSIWRVAIHVPPR